MQEKEAEEVVVDSMGVPLVEVADIATVGSVRVFDRVATAGDELGKADDVATGPESVPELQEDRLEASEAGVVVDPAVVLHESPTTEKRPKRVTPQLDCDFCCAITFCAIP